MHGTAARLWRQKFMTYAERHAVHRSPFPAGFPIATEARARDDAESRPFSTPVASPGVIMVSVAA